MVSTRGSFLTFELKILSFAVDISPVVVGFKTLPLHKTLSERMMTIVYFGRGHELPALSDTGYQHRIEVGPGRINSGGVTGRAGAEDENLSVFHCENLME